MVTDDAPTTPGRPGTQGPTLPAPAASGTGRQIGPYRLLEKVGEGGMGEVWRAEQAEPVRRTVALKLVKAGMDSRDVIARFEAERQALAMMDHPCIARVLDAGATPEGRPYFAMEFVAGVPVTTYCARRRLGTRERLELFQRVCEGVQHAHQKAVLHRDLKPSNVLVVDVDGKPLPKIIDFGVAKAMTQSLTDKTMHTAFGQILGTPEYMSPEQAELTGENVDTRTDVYSLGVILYELLAGALPFDPTELRKAGFEGIRRMIREQDPPRPSTRVSALGARLVQVAEERRTRPDALRRHLRGDLDWIVMRALEKDRNRRYGSARELALDVGRHLDDQPVEAGPPGAAYRVRKFVRRHRTGVAVASALAGVLVAFVAFALAQARSIARERDRAEAEAGKAGAMNDFLRGMLTSADPWSGGGKAVTVAAALDAAAENVGRSFADQPLLEARMRTVLGSTYLSLGLLPQGEEQTRRAFEIRKQHLAPDDPELAESWLGLAAVALEQLDDEGAVSAARASVRILRLREAPEDLELLKALKILGRALARRREFAAADSVLAEVEALCPRVARDPRTLLAEAMLARADVAGELSADSAAPDSMMARALAMHRDVDPADPHVGIVLNNMATRRMVAGELDEARRLFEEAVAATEASFGSDHPQYATALENLANVAFQQKRHDDASALLERVIDIRRRNLGPESVQVLRTQCNLAALAGSEDPARAAEILTEVEPRLRAAVGTDHVDMLTLLRNLGIHLGKVGRDREADAALRESLEIAERLHGPDHVEVARSRMECALSLNRQKRWREAEPLLDAAFPVLLEKLGKDHARTRRAAGALVDLYAATGRAALAERFRGYAG
jgi:non-specific serine/threonine protein kinase/serine/threonine-protein kinase